MNERIRDIAYQTAFEVPFEGPEHFVFYNSDLKEFVKLIVQECANQCDPEPGLKYSPNAKSSREDCKNKILKHFEF